MSATALIVLNADAITTAVTSMFGVSGEGTVRDRVQTYELALDMIRDAPLAGLPASQSVSQSLFISSIHNMWLGVALSSGLIGVLLLFGLLMSGLLGALRLARNVRWKEYGLVMTSMVFAALMFSPNFYPGHNAFIFWFFVGLVLTTHQTLHFSPRSVRGQSSNAISAVPARLDGIRPKSKILRYKS
jgi:O-antigen ligase